MSKRMIACDEAGFLLSYQQDNRLGMYRWMQLKMHLLTCHFCRKYARQIKQLDHAVAIYRVSSSREPSAQHLSEEATARMKQVLVRELDAK